MYLYTHQTPTYWGPPRPQGLTSSTPKLLIEQQKWDLIYEYLVFIPFTGKILAMHIGIAPKLRCQIVFGQQKLCINRLTKQMWGDEKTIGFGAKNS